MTKAKPTQKNNNGKNLKAAEIVGIEPGETVSLAKLREGITIRVPWSNTFVPGSNIIVWLEPPSMSGVNFIFTVTDSKDDFERTLRFDELAHFMGTEVTLGYVNMTGPVYGPPVHYTLEADFYFPIVDGILEGVMPLKLIESGFTVQIPPYENMAAGDKVRLFVAAANIDASQMVPLEVENSEQPLIANIPASQSLRMQGGETHVLYTVYKDNSLHTSRHINFWCEALANPPTPTYILREGFPVNSLYERIDESGYLEFNSTLYFTPPPGSTAYLVLFDAGSVWGTVIEQSIQANPPYITFKIPTHELSSKTLIHSILMITTDTETRSTTKQLIEFIWSRRAIAYKHKHLR
ncbi:hypothetical protein [Pseudomonas sichuanensis]|uniref:hypothetical protein n=1 Tax=Pseudomonas TaxID=286 RepID=UPI0036E32A0F